jgi:chemotaxis protein methyltransferase CheR
MDMINQYYKIQMNSNDFSRLSSYIYNELGIKMPVEKKIMLQSRLQKRLSELKIESFSEYIDYVFSRDGEKSEIFKMIDIVTTNKTDFFREPSHFSFLTDTFLKSFTAQDPKRKNLKIWSAGCSSGEEAYTIAITLSEYFKSNPLYDYSILATDISIRILQKASAAIYHSDRIKDIPLDIKKKYFLKSKDPLDKTVLVSKDLRSKVKFQRLNFMDNVYSADKDFDIIFCRNVLIYFDRETQQNVINKLSDKLKSGGIFFLGHSESITNMDVPLKQIKPTIFQKI